MHTVLIFLIVVFMYKCILITPTSARNTTDVKYTPDWKSLDLRPLPQWYDNAKFGIFIHWGVYSVPSFVSEWFWWYWKGSSPQKKVVDFMTANYYPDFSYADFAPQFRAELFDPNKWVDIFEASGAKYIVATSKHHEGFTMYPSAYSWNWNSNDTGPHRDLIGDLATAVRKKTKLHFGLYFSLFEWFHPLYNKDKKNKFQTTEYVQQVSYPQLLEIVNNYKPEVVWADGDAGPDTYWRSKEFLAWLYNDSPVKDYVVTNDRWGNNGCSCHHGGYYTCKDRYKPGHLLNHKWESCMTIDRHSWGYRREAQLEDFQTTKELIADLVQVVSCGGNFLLNIGPTHYGVITPIFEERLRQLGQWLGINGESIYSSKPWKHQNDTVTPGIWYTAKNSTVYGTFLTWPVNSQLVLGAVNIASKLSVHMLGYDKALPNKPYNTTANSGIVIDLSVIPYTSIPSMWAWTIKIESGG